MKIRLMWLSFVAGLVLMATKFAAYAITHSNAILTDALESIINVIAAGFALFSLYVAARPKDVNHPYGHGKIEFFSAGFEGALIMLAGGYILFFSIQRLFHPVPIENLPLGMLLTGITVAGNGVLSYVLQREGKRTGSITLMADGKHLWVDSLSSLLLVLGVGLVYVTGYQRLDSILSVGFAVYILYNGLLLVRQSVAGLMDETDLDTLGKVVKILRTHQQDGWIDVHNLRVQRYGSDLHIDCHVTLPYYWDLQKVHEENTAISQLVEGEFPGSVEFSIHADPCLPPVQCTYCRLPDCPVRQAPHSRDIAWEIENVARNQKHFEG